MSVASSWFKSSMTVSGYHDKERQKKKKNKDENGES